MAHDARERSGVHNIPTPPAASLEIVTATDRTRDSPLQSPAGPDPAVHTQTIDLADECEAHMRASLDCDVHGDGGRHVRLNRQQYTAAVLSVVDVYLSHDMHGAMRTSTSTCSACDVDGAVPVAQMDGTDEVLVMQTDGTIVRAQLQLQY